jgi:flagellar hook assembly protein FlgD
LAVLDYVLTEPATTFIDIYPPGIQFCPVGAIADPLNSVNNPALDQADPPGPPKNFSPKFDCAAAGVVAPVKRLVEQKNSRNRVISFWDGRDQAGTIQPDGNYVFVLYGVLASQNGFPFLGNAADKRIWTSQAKSGFIPVIRGFVGVSQITPQSSVIGSSPAVAGLSPFIFRYSLSREAIVNMRIFDASGTTLVKTLVRNEVRPGSFGISERWEEPLDDNGLTVSSGTYLVQLTAADPTFPVKVTTTTVLFPVNLFRITDVQVTPLLNGATDVALISYQLSATMNVGLNIYSPGTVVAGSSVTWPPCSSLNPGGACPQVTTGGAPATPIITIRGLRAGRLKITEVWDGRDAVGNLVSDGNYVFTLAAESTTTPKYFATDKIIGQVSVQRGSIIFPVFSVIPDVPPLFHSSATVSLPPFTISYSLTRQSSVTIQILNSAVPPAVVRTVVSGGIRQNGILLQDVWDGRDDGGNFPTPGFYTVRAVAGDLVSQLSSGATAQVTIAFEPIRIYDVAVSPVRLDSPSSSIFYQVSEPMKVSVKIFRPGTIFDGAGNPSPPEASSLVKRIVGVKSARSEIEDIWDGTDLRFTPVSDGPYKFKIVGSTDIRAIDDITGNVLNPSALSLDRIIDEIPVVRNASIDPAGDFQKNTFVYPNPMRGPTATFQIYVPFQAKVKMRVYTIAGEMILDKDFGEQAPSFSAVPVTFVWDKTNQSGRKVARGLYYVVVRVDETLGGKNVLQTVKKILIL